MSLRSVVLLPFVAVTLAWAPAAQADPDLDRIVAESKLAAEKLERLTNFALAEAKVAMNKKDYNQAQDILERALTKVKNSPDLSDTQRTTLRNRLQARLRDVEQHTQANRTAAEEAASKEAERIRREREANQGKGGSGVAGTAGSRIRSTKEQLAAIEKLKAQGGANMVGLLNNLDASASVTGRDIEFPKYWARLIESDYRRSTPKLSKKEAELLRSLNSFMTPDFDKIPFKQVMEYLSEKTGQPIMVDEKSLQDAMIEYDDPVTFQLKVKITVRTILRKVLGDRGLAYIIRDGTIQVMSAQKARETMVIRSYPITDLVGAFNPYDPFSGQVVAANVQALIQTIQNAVEPSHWKENGGPGTITFHAPTMSLIIRASAEMHYMFGAGGMFR